MRSMQSMLGLLPFIIGALLAVILFLLGLPLLSTALFIIGIAMGIGLLFADIHFLSVWYQLEEPFSRSFLFLVIFVPCLIFTMTTSNSLLGNGLVLGIGLSRITDFLQVLTAKPGSVIQGKTYSGQDVPEHVLKGGSDAFTLQELQAITIGLAALITIFALRAIFYL